MKDPNYKPDRSFRDLSDNPNNTGWREEDFESLSLREEADEETDIGQEDDKGYYEGDFGDEQY